MCCANDKKLKAKFKNRKHSFTGYKVYSVNSIIISFLAK